MIVLACCRSRSLCACILFFFAINRSVVEAESHFFSQNEICNNYSGRRIYLELGEEGILQATNVTVPKFAKIERMPNGLTNIHYQCRIELITCAACVFQLTINQTNFTTHCEDDNESCQCSDYLTFSEPPYEQQRSADESWCGAKIVFRSNSRVLVITYFYQSNKKNVFNLTRSQPKQSSRFLLFLPLLGLKTDPQAAYATFMNFYLSLEENQIESNGFAASNATVQSNDLQSPFFPNLYPRDVTVEHIFKCKTGENYVVEDENCRLEIMFSDFQISFSSQMEVYDADDHLLGKYTGEVFRPPIIYSTGPSLTVRFSANGGTGLGYRGIVRYLTQAKVNQTTMRYTHCGGLVESFGGAITMMNMVANNATPKFFDCIWLLKPPNSYMHLTTHIFVRIDTFENMAENSSVTIKDGLTSVSPLLEKYEWPSDKSSQKPFKSFVTSLSSGFYISFSGVFGADSRFAIVYTAFSYMDCFAGPEFLCENHRCIPFYLQCDGFDHCGDSSDENSNCAPNDVNDPNANQHWYTHTPNYFFPKMEDHYPDLKTATLVFLASAMSLILLILLLIVILYRMNHHVREQRELQNQLRTISELLDNNNSHSQHDENDASQEMPPAYESPPDYDEASSLKMDVHVRRSSRMEANRKRRRSRSRSRCNEHNSLLITSTADVPTPLDILIPELFLAEHQLLPSEGIECRQSDTAILNLRRSSQVLLIPESPPPDYSPTHSNISESTTPLHQNLSSLNFLSIPTASVGFPTNASSALEQQSVHHHHQIASQHQQKNSKDENWILFPFNLRRHSSEDDRPYTFFEQQLKDRFTQRPQNSNTNHVNCNNRWDDKKEGGFVNANAINWLKNLNILRYNGSQCGAAQRRNLRRTSSENVLLLMTHAGEQHIDDAPKIRRSYSSGLLF